MKAPRGMVLGSIVLILLIVIAAAQFAFKFTYQDVLLSNFWAFLFSLVSIVILAVVGAAFFGIYLSHRYLTTRQFTPFEEEMLRMRSDITKIKEQLERAEQASQQDGKTGGISGGGGR